MPRTALGVTVVVLSVTTTLETGVTPIAPLNLTSKVSGLSLREC